MVVEGAGFLSMAGTQLMGLGLPILLELGLEVADSEAREVTLILAQLEGSRF
jgi:hypothetical protein